MRSAPQTFARKEEAERYLALVESQIVKGEWLAPEKGRIELADYGQRWVAQRPNLRPRTVHLYEWLLKKHIIPYLGNVTLDKLTTSLIREWRARLLASGTSPGQAAKAYRLLRAILNTATREDELIRLNPCRIPGADKENPQERPVLTMEQVATLSRLVPARFSALILLATYGSLRWGEVSALQRQDIDLTEGTVRVRHAFTEQRAKGLVLGPPKSRAGLRIVVLPDAILPALANHLAAYVEAAPDSLVFTTPTGRPILRGNFNKLVAWKRAVNELGVYELHFHDLRHTGNHFASRTGANVRDLMARMGHDSPRAALIYLHTNAEAGRAIAQSVSDALRSASDEAGTPPPAPARRILRRHLRRRP
jgi:integrase